MPPRARQAAARQAAHAPAHPTATATMLRTTRVRSTDSGRELTSAVEAEAVLRVAPSRKSWPASSVVATISALDGSNPHTVSGSGSLELSYQSGGGQEYRLQVTNSTGTPIAYSLQFSTTSTAPGDYDGDGHVNQNDYSFWRAHFGESSGPGLVADGNTDGAVNAADFVLWRAHVAAAAAAILNGEFPTTPPADLHAQQAQVVAASSTTSNSVADSTVPSRIGAGAYPIIDSVTLLSAPGRLAGVMHVSDDVIQYRDFLFWNGAHVLNRQ